MGFQMKRIISWEGYSHLIESGTWFDLLDKLLVSSCFGNSSGCAGISRVVWFQLHQSSPSHHLRGYFRTSQRRHMGDHPSLDAEGRTFLRIWTFGFGMAACVVDDAASFPISA